jgi:hypothetical protein
MTCDNASAVALKATGAPETEIEVRPAMIEAGREAMFAEFDGDEFPGTWSGQAKALTAAYRAMCRIQT